MIMDFRLNKKSAWSRWFQRGFGRWVSREEARLCQETLHEVFGVLGVQLGGYQSLLAASPVRHKIILTRQAGDMVADWRELPLESDSLDLLVLVHALEASQEPHAVLREAVRVLRPEGRLIIIGFNRFSLLSCSGAAPWRKNWLSVGRINDWLTLLEMQPIGGAYAVFLPPFQSALKKRWRLRWLELAGRRWWPLAGGIFALHAVKRRYHLRLVKPPFNRSLKQPSIAAAPKPTLSDGNGVQSSVIK